MLIEKNWNLLGSPYVSSLSKKLTKPSHLSSSTPHSTCSCVLKYLEQISRLLENSRHFVRERIDDALMRWIPRKGTTFIFLFYFYSICKCGQWFSSQHSVFLYLSIS